MTERFTPSSQSRRLLLERVTRVPSSDRRSARHTARLLVGLLAGLVCSCASPYSTETLAAFEEKPAEGIETARVVLGSATWMEVDGYPRVDTNGMVYREVEVLPGMHTLRWGSEFGVSYLVDPRMVVQCEDSETLFLEAGHTYSLHLESTSGWEGRRYYSFINDDTAARLIERSSQQ